MLHDLRKRLAGWVRTNRDIRKLRGLDNHLLADVGIARENIAACVKGRCEP